MKIYFACAVRAGRDGAATYSELVGHLKVYGEVLSERFGDKSLTSHGDPDSAHAYSRDLAWLRSSDAVVAGVSFPSLGVGYEIRDAEHSGKPVLCLYRNQIGKRLSAMIEGNPNVSLARYDTIEQANAAIESFFGRILRQA